jgi:hypothetical protein
LRHLVRDIDQTIERHVPASDTVLRLLTAYLDALCAVENVAEPSIAGVRVADLVASVLREKPAGNQSGESPSL